MSRFDVWLVQFEEQSRQQAVLQICRVFKMQPEQAKTIVESLPRVVKFGIDDATARSFARALEAIGGNVRIQPTGSAAPGLVPSVPLARPSSTASAAPTSGPGAASGAPMPSEPRAASASPMPSEPQAASVAPVAVVSAPPGDDGLLTLSEVDDGELSLAAPALVAAPAAPAALAAAPAPSAAPAASAPPAAKSPAAKPTASEALPAAAKTSALRYHPALPWLVGGVMLGAVGLRIATGPSDRSRAVLGEARRMTGSYVAEDIDFGVVADAQGFMVDSNAQFSSETVAKEDLWPLIEAALGMGAREIFFADVERTESGELWSSRLVVRLPQLQAGRDVLIQVATDLGATVVEHRHYIEARGD